MSALLRLVSALVLCPLFLCIPPVEGEQPATSNRTNGPRPTDSSGDPLPPGVVARLGTVRLRHGDAVQVVTFSPEGALLVGQSGWLLLMWDTAAKKPMQSLDVKSSIPIQPLFSPDGRSLATVDGSRHCAQCGAARSTGHARSASGPQAVGGRSGGCPADGQGEGGAGATVEGGCGEDATLLEQSKSITSLEIS